MNLRWRMLVSGLLLAAAVSCSAPNTNRAVAPAPPANAPVQREAMPNAGTTDNARPGAAPAPSGSAQTLDRMIVRNAALTLQVSQLDTAIDEATRIARDSGGFVFATNFRDPGGNEGHTAVMELRVPSARYEEVLSRLRKLAVRVREETSSAQDVTEEYSDLQAQLRNLEATEAQYQELLRRANTIEDILKIQQRLSETRNQIERIKGRMLYLERRSDLASIKLTFVTEADSTLDPVANWEPAKVARQAWNASLILLQGLANIMIFIVVFFWWLLPIVAVLAVLIGLQVRSRRRRRAASVGGPTAGAATA